ncbi:MAG: hypothetical protein ABI359_14570 [Ginsengibacter sp.]
MAFNYEKFVDDFFPYHGLWPVPQSAIDANVSGHINQNQGYNGSAGNVPALETLPDNGFILKQSLKYFFIENRNSN